MAALSGTAGSVTLSGTTVAEIAEWSLNMTHAPVEVTAFGDVWQRYIPSLRGATGSFSGNFDESSAQHQALRNSYLGGSAIALNCHISGTAEFVIGTAYITAFNPAVSVDGKVNTSFDFQVSGAVTYA